jgi:hypothetical protein
MAAAAAAAAAGAVDASLAFASNQRVMTTHLDPRLLEGFLVFSFSRDPATRIVSSFHQVISATTTST